MSETLLQPDQRKVPQPHDMHHLQRAEALKNALPELLPENLIHLQGLFGPTNPNPGQLPTNSVLPNLPMGSLEP